ncbi:Piso0_000640 [Millerozyma farinosa CBS 7064]|uniref:Piso0_000640 protein n=1 Tax=Pichia sorbitophila (strain ATCC MYA-4447 / BCRC 22081 / CBS 7064 / NBRC 10061 / NRRL Y-12695) TaxID=559304 RepID=G8YPN0_PICSO|nr:Piso0_000640 [Millerozyma farinosa CBS 7064]
MFHLASSLYDRFSRREQYNILILGLDNAGKTSLLEHLKLVYPGPGEKKKPGERDTTQILKSKRILPTVGQNVTTIRYSTQSQPRHAVNLKFWDLGGQRSLRNMWARYYSSCHGIIFIIDSTDTERFQECYDTLVDVTRHQSWRDEAGGPGPGHDSVNVPILMMANKQDLPAAVDLVSLKTGYFIDLVSELDASDSKLLPVSVLENQGIRESLDWLVSRIVYNKTNRLPEYR